MAKFQTVDHPRGQPLNPGQFREKDVVAPPSGAAADLRSQAIAQPVDEAPFSSLRTQTSRTVDGSVDDVIPQANRVDTISSVVDAISDGCTSATLIAEAIGMSGRQGGYYPNAARTLGLAESHHGDWALTPLGEEFASLGPAERTSAMCDILGDNSYVNAFISDGPEALASDWEAQGLSDTTIDRRLASVGSWCDFYTLSRAKQEAMMAEACTGTRERAPRVREAHRTAMAARAPRTDRRCGQCNSVIAPALQSCEMCG